MMTVEHDDLFSRIKTIKNLINPNMLLTVSSEILRISDERTIKLSNTKVALDDSHIICELGNVGVDFNYVVFVSETESRFSPFLIRMKYGTMHMLVDEYYHLIDDSMLKHMISRSTIIEFGQVVKECNFS